MHGWLVHGISDEFHTLIPRISFTNTDSCVLVVVLDVFLMRCLSMARFDFLVCFMGNCDDTCGFCVFNSLHVDLSVIFNQICLI